MEIKDLQQLTSAEERLQYLATNQLTAILNWYTESNPVKFMEAKGLDINPSDKKDKFEKWLNQFFDTVVVKGNAIPNFMIDRLIEVYAKSERTSETRE